MGKKLCVLDQLLSGFKWTVEPDYFDPVGLNQMENRRKGFFYFITITLRPNAPTQSVCPLQGRLLYEARYVKGVTGPATWEGNPMANQSAQGSLMTSAHQKERSPKLLFMAHIEIEYVTRPSKIRDGDPLQVVRRGEDGLT